MSVHAGTIIHVGGQAVINRLQSAGLGDVTVPMDTIREVGNVEVVDKIAQDPEFTFSMESYDVSTHLEAWLTGKVGTSPTDAPGDADPDGTEYSFLDVKPVNIPSPWKDATTGSAGTVVAGHLVPGYFPTRIRYAMGVTDDASQTVDLAGGSYYYGKFAPVEEFLAGDGATTDFPISSAAVGYRIGGKDGTTFRRLFGVIVDGVVQTRGVDYTETGPVDATAAVAHIVFTVAPKNGAKIRLCYFTNVAKAYPQTVHPSSVTKPAAVRGRNICVYVGSGGSKVLLGGVQSFALDATVDSAVEREFCNDEITARTINGYDVNGTLGVRSKTPDAFFALLSKLLGIAQTEIFGWFNDNPLDLEIQIRNPKNPAQVLKTLYVPDAKFQTPGTGARVNSPTDFNIQWSSKSGKFSAFKGAKP